MRTGIGIVKWLFSGYWGGFLVASMIWLGTMTVFGQEAARELKTVRAELETQTEIYQTEYDIALTRIRELEYGIEAQAQALESSIVCVPAELFLWNSDELARLYYDMCFVPVSMTPMPSNPNRAEE